MAKRMLIDATHAEETRVVVMEGSRLEDYDVETQSRKQLKGNIYLAKVVRVEPSLQAAFVEYGGNRHGFLAFGEIHPDYYQIPVADRQRLLQMQEEEARAEEEAAERAFAGSAPGDVAESAPESAVETDAAAQPLPIGSDVLQFPPSEHAPAQEPAEADGSAEPEVTEAATASENSETGEPAIGPDLAPEAMESAPPPPTADASSEAGDSEPRLGSRVEEVPATESAPPETIGGETGESEEGRERRPPPRFMRNYKIQEVIRRRQILLVQVVKEERGGKGAALTTYISLAGRYCVLMPNSPRGGGISRKITSGADRRRLREVTAELEIPRGMGLIVRTAGANRPKPEIKRDCEYLLRLWDEIRDTTLRSIAPALIHEEASLIKRAIRDVYSRDVDELLVEGEEGWKAARDYMRMLMPTHVKKVQLWREPQPLFSGQNVEAQLDAMLSPTVQLRSGGYLVIDQTEALVAIDVNSGRSTRERGIEETALRTNLEAAEEVARQLRLRDLAGLIVIDFIDMESKRNISAVERRLKEALRDDRARIQVGSISHFGLLEMSRQRLRPSLAETSLTICAHCNGAGRVRSTESAALHVLRAIEEEGGKRRAAEICVYVAPSVALYILNHKRARLGEIEARHAMRVGFAADDALQAAQLRIERLRPQTQELPPPAPLPLPVIDEGEAEAEPEEAETLESSEGAEDSDAGALSSEESEHRRRRRRRRRRGSRTEESGTESAPMPDGAEQPDLGEGVPFPVLPDTVGAAPAEPPVPGHDEAAEAAEEQGKTRARGRRGGRRRKREDEAAPPPPPEPAYIGPTPADPFALGTMDIFEVMERAEAQATPKPAPSPEPIVIPIAAQPEEPEAGPAIKPVVIGLDETPAEKKRGWWKR